jgi:hypothetical protein
MEPPKVVQERAKAAATEPVVAVVVVAKMVGRAVQLLMAIMVLGLGKTAIV